MGKKNKKKNRSGSIDQQHPSPQPQPTTTLSSALNSNNHNNAAATFRKQQNDEDLSLQRHDEQTVLSAIYGDDFTLESGAWNCPVYKLRIRPASDVTDHHNGSTTVQLNNNNNTAATADDDDNNQQYELTLSIQLTHKYPHSIPLLQITNNNSTTNLLAPNSLSDLLARLSQKATECSQKGDLRG